MLERVKSYKYYLLFRNIFKFEIFYKLITLFLLSPILRKIVQTYLNNVSHGIAFNQDIVFQFLSVQGILLVLFLFTAMILIVYYEMNVIIQIIAMNQQKKSYSLRKLMIKSLLSLKSLHIPTFLLCGIYFVLLLPLVHIGYLNSYIPRWDIPHFIFSELRLTMGGQFLICLIYIIYYGAFILLLFVPLYMILKRSHFLKAIRESFRLLKRITLQEKMNIFLWIFGWIFVEYLMMHMIPYSILHNRDFNLYFIKYIINSTAFRYSALQYVLLYLTNIFMMIFFMKYMMSLFSHYEEYQTIDQLTLNTEPMNQRILKFQNFIKTTYQKIIQRCSRIQIYQKHKRLSQIVLSVTVLCLLSLYLRKDALIHRPWVIGHRGSGYYVENTYEAVKGAYESGADYAEIDIQLSKDGVPVVYHDATLSRLSQQDDKISDMKASELEQVALLQNNHQSHLITLEKLIQKMQSEKMTIGLLIEFKPSGDAKEMVEKVIEIIEKYQFENQSIFMSLNYESVQLLSQQKPKWWVGYCIYGSVGDIDDEIWDLKIDFLAMEENRASTAMIQKATKHMLPIYIWTVDNSKRMKQYLDMGVCGLITNDPKLGKTVIQNYENKNFHYYHYDGKGYPKQSWS